MSRAAVDSYLSSAPRWEILLDRDALSEEEGVPWAFHGAECLAPEYRRCLVRLSRGGSDASEIRELDVDARSFVQNVSPDEVYPEALFYSTTRDDRVHPGHARKMVAKMLASDGGRPGRPT